MDLRKRTRDSQEQVIKIEATPHGILITYKHGKKQKTTYIPTAEISELMDFEPPENAIKYSLIKRKDDIEYYRIKIVDEETYRAFQRLYILGYKTGKYGNKFKETIGIKIAIDFLENIFKGYPIDHIERDFDFRDRYGVNVHPDLIVEGEFEADVTEVKFLSQPHLMEMRLREAEKELNEQIDKLEDCGAIQDLKIKHKTIILITYNFKETVNEGVLLIKRSKILWRK